MITLNTTTRILQLVLGGAVTTNQLESSVAFRDVRYADGAVGYGNQLKASNNTTDVNILDAPPSGVTRMVDTLHVYNKDTVAATVTIKIDDNGTEYILVKTTLAAGDTLVYEDG